MAERSVSEVTDVAVDGLPTLRKPTQTASDVVDFIKPIHSSPYAVTPGNGRPAPTTLTAAASFAVGDRVAVKGKGAGTVRFAGPHHVEGTPRLGVELDDPTGKNNGTVTGHRYFSCAPGHGALVKPDKATASAVGTFGVDAKGARVSSQNVVTPNHGYLKITADDDSSDEDTEFGFGVGAIEAEFG